VVSLYKEGGAWIGTKLRAAGLLVNNEGGGAGGIRTLDRALQPYNGLANRRLQPLGHSSGRGGYARRGGEPQAAGFKPPDSRALKRPLPGLYIRVCG
jgi:hypothetical protein